MEIKEFIDNYREAFSEKAELPVAFWYSDTLEGALKKTQGCMFKALPAIRAGEIVSMNAETIGCGGGKFYTGFAEMNDYIPTFVSLKEKYKQTPEQVREEIDAMQVPRATHRYLHLARIDRLPTFEGIEGLFFLATPDVLTGLCTWAFFDITAPNAVATLFGSGCSAVITQTVRENRGNGHRTFLGFFDPSVRPYVESDRLSFAVPMSRFREMLGTMRSCFLYDTHAWSKVKKRIAGDALISPTLHDPGCGNE